MTNVCSTNPIPNIIITVRKVICEPRRSFPKPIDIPIAATAQIAAAVVKPMTLSRFVIIVPAHRKPKPWTMLAAMWPRSGNDVGRNWVSKERAQVDRQTSAQVRTPAGLWFTSRSMPIIMPQIVAKSIKRKGLPCRYVRICE